MTAGLVRPIVRLLLPCLLAVFGTDARAVVRFDFEHTLFTEPPQPVLDHCVVEEDGVYHLFYLRGNPAVNIGHATTTDFVHWTTEAPVLEPGTWDNKALWAPQLFRHPATPWWCMYYTGVNTVSSQQTGIAFSNDLAYWFKYADPVYHPDPSWAEWSETNFSHGRDPHVIEDGGRYYLFVTAKTTQNRGAVACAVSDNLVHWEDIGPIFVNSNWHVLESVFIFRHNGRFQMFFTEEAVNGTSAMSSDSLLSGWDMATRRIIDGGHAPQVTDTHLGEMFSRHAVYNDAHGTLQYIIRFTPLLWSGDIPAVPKPLPLADQWTFVAGDAFYYQPVWNHNAAVRNDNYAKTWLGDGWINTYEYYTGPLGYGIPGSTQGEGKTGRIRSQAFTIEGSSMSVLVGGSELPGECYVALIDATSGEVLFSETGRNSNEMDQRRWDIRPYQGRSVQIEIADLSAVGHVCVDEIEESFQVGGGGGGGGDGSGSGRTKDRPGFGEAPGQDAVAGPARLHANVPNPFNPATSIAFELPRAGRVRLDIFDATGARVRTLVDGTRVAGLHREPWTGTDDGGKAVSSGVYFYRLVVDGAAVDTRKMVLLK
ncbi:MAG TPA: family 43 glycosylhydrolase [Candidatus Krumholzibacteria bacterium]|nr:family 43 glycosylhydrolase [Candidatus Krumholzibacteria bacterium]